MDAVVAIAVLRSHERNYRRRAFGGWTPLAQGHSQTLLETLKLTRECCTGHTCGYRGLGLRMNKYDAKLRGIQESQLFSDLNVPVSTKQQTLLDLPSYLPGWNLQGFRLSSDWTLGITRFPLSSATPLLFFIDAFGLRPHSCTPMKSPFALSSASSS